MSAPSRSGATLERAFLLSLVAFATISFLWLVAPFSGAILWAVIASVVFEPLNARLLALMPCRRNAAAIATLLVTVGIVVVPALLLGAALLRELAAFYVRVRSGQIDISQQFLETQSHLPSWARAWLVDVGLGDISGLRMKLGQGFANSFQAVVAQVLSIGQGTFGFFVALGVMLYLTFFLLRDGRDLATQIERAIPLTFDQRAVLAAKFIVVIRATIKGSLIVAILQGMTGGLVFRALGIPGALLWGVAMGVFSLFPAIGTGLIWVPVATYLLLTGAVWQAVILAACGFFIISTVDNIVRPLLVGHDARMPDYVVLIATLGGFELMGFNGFIVGPVIAALFMAAWELVSLTPDVERLTQRHCQTLESSEGLCADGNSQSGSTNSAT